MSTEPCIEYRPPDVKNLNISKDKNATLGVKFSQRVYFLDPWSFMLTGKSGWERIWFRLRHPIPYAKRGWNRLYRRVRRLFLKDRMVPRFPRQ